MSKVRERWLQAKPFVPPLLWSFAAMAVLVYVHELGHFAMRWIGAQSWSIPFPASTATPDEFRGFATELSSRERIAAALAGPGAQIGVVAAVIAFAVGRGLSTASRSTWVMGAVVSGSAVTFALAWRSAAGVVPDFWGNDLPKVAALLEFDQTATLHWLSGAAVIITGVPALLWLWVLTRSAFVFWIWAAAVALVMAWAGVRGEAWTIASGLGLMLALWALMTFSARRRQPGDLIGLGVTASVVLGALLGAGFMDRADCVIRIAFFGTCNPQPM